MVVQTLIFGDVKMWKFGGYHHYAQSITSDSTLYRCPYSGMWKMVYFCCCRAMTA